MQGRSFLEPARDLVVGGAEPHWRAATTHAYYALMLECRDTLFHWGCRVPPRQNVHSWVRLQLVYAGDAALKSIGLELEWLGRRRNDANYNLAALPDFTTVARAQEAIQRAETALALLDAIEADPVRRAATIASLPP